MASGAGPRRWAAYRRRPRRQRSVLYRELDGLILKLAEQNPRWGVQAHGELRKLGHRSSHWTVRKVLRRHGLPPALRRGQRSWHEFVHEQAEQILACDFVDKVRLARLYVLFFIEVGSRRVHIAGCTYQPTGAWVAQPARNLAWKLQGAGRKVKFLVLGEFIEHYHHARPHQGLEQRRPYEPDNVLPFPTGRVERRDRLGGLLHEYFRAA